MTVFGDTFINYVAKHLIRPDILIYLEMMLTFTGFPDYYAQDQSINLLSLINGTL